MPKKSKVNKLAKMSDEERARYLQHRADLEEEARRRKRELVARFIKNKLDKEEAFSRTNTAKLNQVWRYVLRRIKCKQMMVDIQSMVNTFNYTVERKDRLLTSLMKAIEDADDQHRRIFQAHTENISYFMSIGTQRLDKLQSDYEQHKYDLLDSWCKEESNITDSQDRAEFKLKLVTFIQQTNFTRQKNEMETKRATAVNDARLELEEELCQLHLPKDQEIEQLRSRLREVYHTYFEQHNPIMSHYRSLREKDEFYQRDIARNDHQIRQATKMALTLQKQWNDTTSNLESKLTRVESHKAELSRKYWQLKKMSKVHHSRNSETLVWLVDFSQSSIERLEEAKRKLEKINQLAEICRKYENDLDVMPLEIEQDSNRSREFENLDEFMIKECKEYSKMDKFFLKVNHAKVQVMCLKAEKAKLNKENLQLKNYLKRFLTELALKNERQRPVSVGQLPTRVQRFNTKIERPVTCIEGALCNAVMHEKRMKLLEKKKKDLGPVRAYPRFQNWMETY